jgi:hypothetical protein
MLPICTICAKSSACLKRGAPAPRNGKARSLRMVRKVGRYRTQSGIRAQPGSEELAIEEPRARRRHFGRSPPLPPRLVVLFYSHLLIPALFTQRWGILVSRSFLFLFLVRAHHLRFSHNFTNFASRSQSTQHTLTYPYLCPPSAIALRLAPLERTAIVNSKSSCSLCGPSPRAAQQIFLYFCQVSLLSDFEN